MAKITQKRTTWQSFRLCVFYKKHFRLSGYIGGYKKEPRGAVLFLRGDRAVIDDCRSLFFDCFARDGYFDLSGLIFGAVRSKLLSVRALTRSSSTLSSRATVNQWVLFMW